MNVWDRKEVFNLLYYVKCERRTAAVKLVDYENERLTGAILAFRRKAGK
jgi:hypothetical protein